MSGVTFRLSGRADLDEFFSQSDISWCKKLVHTPAIAFLVEEIDGTTEVHVNTYSNPKDLLRLPDETPVMMQWSGKWRSDFFQFTVGDYRASLPDREAADGV
jgi:hypothetical protein